MPRSNRTDWIILAVMSVFLAGGVYLLTRDSRNNTAPGMPMPSTRLSSPAGMLAYYRLLEQLGFNANRSDLPLMTDTLAQSDVVILPASPFGLRKGEITDLWRWIQAGGVLVCSPDIVAALETGESAGGMMFDLGSEDGLSFQSLEASDRDLPLARGIDNIDIDKYGASVPGEHEPLLACPEGVVIDQRSYGQGLLIVVHDFAMLSNARIGLADNAVVGTNLAGYLRSVARGPRLAFAEYHMSPGRGGLKVLLTTVMVSPAGWSIGVATLAGLAWLWARGRRFGYRRDRAQPQRHTRAKFAAHIGATYAARRAHRLTLKLLFGWFRRKLCRLAGRAENVSDEELAHAVSRIKALQPRQVLSVLTETRRILQAERPKRTDLQQAVRSIKTLERELSDGFVPSQ